MTQKTRREPKAAEGAPERILLAAAEVFGSMGVAGASIRAIAKAADCDPALIYYYFKSKEGIFEALVQRLFGRVQEHLGLSLKESQGSPTSLRLWLIVQSLILILNQEGRGLQGLVRGQMVRGADGLRAMVASHIRPVLERMTEVFAEGMAKGELRKDLLLPVIPVIFMRATIELLELIPVMSSHVVGRSPQEALPLVLRAWFELFWRGIAADPSRPLSHPLEMRP